MTVSTKTLLLDLGASNIFIRYLALAVFSIAGVASAQMVEDRPPNIIVVFTDDHGWADLGVHGVVDDILTPNLDALARDGVRFNAGYITAPQCIPSRAGIISGRYQQSFGVDDNRYSPMPVEEVTIAERLRDAGYTTGMVGKWHLDPNVASQEWLAKNTYAGKVMPAQDKRRIPLSDLLPFRPGNQGFDEYFCGYIWDYWANYDLSGNGLKQSGERLRVEETDRLDVQTDAALAFIKRNHDDPFFLYLAYYAPHVPLESSEKYLSRFPGEMPERRRYALAMISAVDEGVGLIREQLGDYGILDNTIIFFIGDNGAPLKITMEDIPVTFKGGAWDGSLNTPLRGEKGMLSEGGIRVPFLMSWPAKLRPGQVSDIPVSSLDVAATAVKAAGLGEMPELPGEDILALMRDPLKAQERPLYWRFWNQAAIRVGDWKYLRAGDEEFLFHISDDMTESENRIAAELELAAQLRQRWKDWNATLQRPFDGEAGLLNNQEAKWYAYYFGTGTASDK
ncbi:sulfatase-like hydrolase/transferase [Rubellicoccus peritrichatus]|uniref:Sulfatase-like hydrolase/transferase n=1 Tax=Rubellicoccus peritrichatus TaxID=3080537 RepID=A0AAQ3LD56_9BACT|nr:sulfatase-like hydrolase/transferase [Puniceicoccus sp. CR14]WOO43301.1 sulfatase-like hydrolase/transferase [Puniceicoccus sp. CR14]